MLWYHWVFVALAIYGVIGIATAVTLLSQTSIAGAGWLWLGLFWPLFWFAILFG